MIFILSGVAFGFLLACAAAIFVMRGYMITTRKIDAPFDQVCAALEKASTSVPGWGHPIPNWNFHSAVAKTHCFERLSKKKIFFICKAEYANRIVDKFHHMGAMMPCSWSVYETTKGEVFLAKMNIGLMSRLFFGNIIGSTMAKVAREEQLIMTRLHQLLVGDAPQTS